MMEPMTLGSPVHTSPCTPVGGPGGGGGGSQQQGFLPGYLMGDISAPHHHQGSGRLISPTKVNRSLSTTSSNGQIGGGNPGSTPGTPLGPVNMRNNGGFLTPTTPMSHQRNNNMSNRLSEKQPGGPPITGLYSNVIQQSSGTPNNRSLIVNSGTPYGTPTRAGNFSLMGTPGISSTPIPTTPQLSFGAGTSVNNSIGEEIPYHGGKESRTWITVFGFPPSASAYIISQFSQYGTVLQHHSPPNGNWMHIRYQTKIQAQKALSKSGKILGGSIMIGVSPCSDTAFMDEMSSQQQEYLNGSQLNSSNVMGVNDATNLNASSIMNKSSIRPLTQAYKDGNSDHDVLANPNTPDKANGFVTKAMEYVFGW